MNRHTEKSSTFLIFTLLAVLSMLSGCAGINSDKTVKDNYSSSAMRELYDTIDKEMKLKNITGLSIAVADSEQILFSEGFGLSNRKGRQTFSDETVSNTGSVSKLITATAIMKLAEIGKIDLDAPVSAYIPEFNPRESDEFKNPVTVRMLLNHESGLESDGFYDFYLGYEKSDDAQHSYRRAVDAVNQSGMVREPYTIFSYCNMGYSLLGVILERIQGPDFQTAVEELVFKPVGMNDSTFIIDQIPASRMARGYSAGKDVSIPYIRDMPAGSLNTCAKDMGYFLRNILSTYKNDTGILEKETLLEMFTPSNGSVSNDLDFKIGLGWWIVDLDVLPGEYILGHGGDLPPFHSLLAVLPERDLAVFIMVNSVDGVGSFSLTDILAQAVRTFSEEKKQSPVKPSPADSPVVAVSEAAKTELPGFYASSSGLAEIKTQGNELKIYAFNRWLDLYSHEDGTMSLGMKILGLIPIKLPIFDEISITTEQINGNQAINLRLQGILVSPCIRIEPVPVNPAWLDRTGEYVSVHSEIMPQYSGFKIEFDRKSGFLCLCAESADGWSRFPLQSQSTTEARLMGIGRGLGGKILVETDADGESLRFLNYVLRKQ